jgi:hypothetical protein
MMAFSRGKGISVVSFLSPVQPVQPNLTMANTELRERSAFYCTKVLVSKLGCRDWYQLSVSQK